MNLSFLDIFIIGIYLVISLIIGLYYKNRASKSLSDFFLGGRKFPWWLAGLSMVATTFAADTPLAVTELTAKNGISGNWLWWNMLIGGMLTVFFFAKLWRRAEVLTEVEFIELRYGGKPAKYLRGIKAVYLGIFMNTLIIAWVNLAMITIVEVFLGVNGFISLGIVAAIMLLTTFYSALSGIWGVAITDAIQFIFAMLGTIILAIVVVNSDKIGGIEGLKTSLPESTLNFFPSFAENSQNILTIGLGSFFVFALLQWWASWYPGAEPGGGGYIAQRILSCKDEKHSFFATLFFQIAHYALRPWAWILVGLATLVLYPELPAESKRLGYVMAMKEFLPTGLRGLLLATFLAAYMSTISTQLNFGASVLTNDLFKILFPKRENSVKTARWFTIFIMILSLVVTTKIESISGAWQFLIECGAGLGMVLILRWFWWRINVWSEISATLSPFLGYVLSNYVLKLDFPVSYFVTVTFTTVVWLVVTFFTPSESREVLEKFYLQIKPQGFWKPISEKFNIEIENSLLFSVFAWLSSIVFVYSILFLIGKILFFDVNGIILCGVVAIISFLILYFSIRKAKII